MKQLVYGIATRHWDGWRDCVKSWNDTASEEYPYILAGEMDVLEAYQRIYVSTTEPIIAQIHDDCMISEQDWDKRILREFDDPHVGVVGFGGSTGHGDPMMYKMPYYLPNLRRSTFMSNMRDAERHGIRFTKERDVVVLDGFAIFVRRELLDNIGGWPVNTPVGYFCYDYWICAMARRHGYKIRLVGIACDHLGGKSSGRNPTANLDFEGSHRYIYDNFKDVLPARIPW